MSCILSLHVHHNDFAFRANIESFYGSQVDKLRKEYTQGQKELIEEYMEAKKGGSLKHECPDQKVDSSLVQKILLKEELEGLRG